MKPTTWQIMLIHQDPLAPTHESRYPKCVREKIIQKYSVLILVGQGRISSDGGRVRVSGVRVNVNPHPPSPRATARQ